MRLNKSIATLTSFLGIIIILLSHLFKRHASLTQQYAGLQEGRVQRKITRSIKIISYI